MSRSVIKAICYVLIAVGLASMAIALAIKTRSGPTEENYLASEVPVYRTPLDSLAKGGARSFAVAVPSTPQWKRILEFWGDPGFMVFAAPNTTTIYQFSNLNIDVRVTKDGRRLPVEQVVHLPYMRSVEAGTLTTPGHRPVGLADTGVVFRVAPGDEVDVEIVPRSPESLPRGELIVKREWSLAQKDHMIAPAAERLLFIAPLALGIICIVLAGAMIALSRLTA
jgi:hypothetical protein